MMSKWKYVSRKGAFTNTIYYNILSEDGTLIVTDLEFEIEATEIVRFHNKVVDQLQARIAELESALEQAKHQTPRFIVEYDVFDLTDGYYIKDTKHNLWWMNGSDIAHQIKPEWTSSPMWVPGIETREEAQQYADAFNSNEDNQS